MTLDDVYAWFRYCLQVGFLHFLHQNVCKLIEKGMLPDANIFTSRYVKEEGLKITQVNIQFLADYYLMGRKDKDLSPEELW